MTKIAKTVEASSKPNGQADSPLTKLPDPGAMSDEQLRASAAAIEKKRKEQYAKQKTRNAEKREFAKRVLAIARERGLVDEKGNVTE